MAFSRACVIERVLGGEQFDSPPGPSHYSTLEHFEKENIREVEHKLQKIDNQIWGKVIIMEHNFRIAKAYIRNQSVCIDNEDHEFDGVRLGIKRFSTQRGKGSSAMHNFEKGLLLWIDNIGNLWLQRNCIADVSVSCDGATKVVDKEPCKIFSLTQFKEKVMADVNGNHPLPTEFLKKCFVHIQISPSTSLLDSPLWICVIHLIAFEMATILSRSSAIPYGRSLSSTSHSPASSESRRLGSSRDGTTLYDAVAEMGSELFRNAEDYGQRIPRYSSASRKLVDSAMSRSVSSASHESDHPSSRLTRSRAHSPETNNYVKSRSGVQKHIGRLVERDRSLNTSQQDFGHPAEHSCGVIDLRSLVGLRRPIFFGNQNINSNRSRSMNFLDRIHK